ncbi:BF3164 family lipoprotein [Algoriphagus terrigena]|uniref:BF3164 family lipoprotein n=1 Tax=Algoriphagus terrigena TaxID=344884 RepID=UPI00047AC20C|nr:BF3164 family lipoprotein [Algoriphagus terrigena]
MFKKNSHIIVIAIAAFFLSCSVDKPDLLGEEIKYVKQVDFPQIQELDFQPLDLFPPGRVETIEILDSLMFLADLEAKKNIHVIDIKNRSFLGSFIDRGRNEGTALSISDLMVNRHSNTVYAYDIMNKKILSLGYDRTDSLPLKIIEEFYFPDVLKGKYSFDLAFNNRLYFLSYDNDLHRFFSMGLNENLLNLKETGKLSSGENSWPEKHKDSFFGIKSVIYSGIIGSHPTKNYQAISYKYFDRIDLYKNDTITKILIGPDNLSPEFEFFKEGEFSYDPRPMKGFKYAHMELHTTDSYFFSLYAGYDDNTTCGKRIFVFDWEGSPIIELNSDFLMCSIAIKQFDDHFEIFTINSSDNQVYKASFKL